MSKKDSNKQKPRTPETVGSGNAGFFRRYRLECLAALALIVITWLAFAPVLDNGFIDLDDGDYIYDNPVVQSGLNWLSLQWALTSTKVSGYPHPLTWITHYIDYELFGLDAGGHHRTNVLLHIANALLLFLLLRVMTGALWRSALVAALFAVHPLRVESVAWVAERKDVLAGTFFLLGLLSYARYAREAGPGQRGSLKSYALVAGAFAMGLMSKPTVLTFPFVLLLLDYWPLRRWLSLSDARRLVMEKAPLLAMSVAWGVVSYLGQAGAGATKELASVPLTVRTLNAVYSYGVYLWKTLWPANLAPIYAYKDSLPWAGIAVSALVLTAITVLALRYRAGREWGIMGWLWHAGVLFPMAGIIQYGLGARADRNTYLPAIGLLVALVWMVEHILPRRLRDARILAAAALVVIAPLVWASRKQCGVWKDNLTLFGHNVAVEPGNKYAIANLALAYHKAGDYEKALEFNEAALKLDPKMTVAYERMAMSQFKLGQNEAALKNIELVLVRHPAYPDGHFNRGIILSKLDRMEEAMAAYRKALSSGLRPERAASARNSIGTYYSNKGMHAEALREFEEALRADEMYILARKNKAISLVYLGRRKEAMEELSHYLAVRPGDLGAQRLVDFIRSGKDVASALAEEETGKP